MAATQQVSENFNKSRLTSLVMSTAAFLVSVTDDASLKALKIFEVSIEGINRRFLICAFILAAAISLASLLLSYVNEERDRLRQRLGGLPEANAQSVIDKISLSIDSVVDAKNNIERQIESRGITDPANSLVQLDVEVLNNLWANAFTDSMLDEILDEFMLAKPRAIMERESDNTMWEREILEQKERIRLQIFSHFESLLSQNYDGVGALAWNGDYAYLKKRLCGSLLEAIEGMNVSANNLKRYHRSMKFASLFYQVEARGLGVGIPIILFIIAFMHALGGIFGGFMPSLPELFR